MAAAQVKLDLLRTMPSEELGLYAESNKVSGSLSESLWGRLVFSVNLISPPVHRAPFRQKKEPGLSLLLALWTQLFLWATETLMRRWRNQVRNCHIWHVFQTKICSRRSFFFLCDFIWLYLLSSRWSCKLRVWNANRRLLLVCELTALQIFLEVFGFVVDKLPEQRVLTSLRNEYSGSQAVFSDTAGR